MTRSFDVRESVRRRYAAAASRFASGEHDEARAIEAPHCDPTTNAAAASTTEAQNRVVFGADLYRADTAEGAPDAAVAASLGCGVPTAVADLRAGETVLDLGSGAGADVLISARRVTPGGRVLGLEMTTEMVELARRNADEAGVTNVEFVEGYLESLPLREEGVDVVISNCVINLAADKDLVLREAARVLRPGGRFAVADVIVEQGLDHTDRSAVAQSTGCIAGALTDAQYRAALTAAGLVDIEINETHPVHAHASSAIIRARKPTTQMPH